MNLALNQMVNVSIVLYKHSTNELLPIIETIRASKAVATLFLIDNSPVRNKELDCIQGIRYIFNGKNIGYGAAHNVAMRLSIQEKIKYHLVVNPDIEFDSTVLDQIENFMDKNTEIGLLMPKVFYPSGQIQYLCKLLPTPSDLIFRRFLPPSWTQQKRNRFELRNTGYNQLMDVPYLSGCFMFLRVEALCKVGLFDEQFFMYPEDIDLTRRIHKEYRTVFYPDVSVVHHHAQGSYVNFDLLKIHVINMIRYFHKWGWFFDPERKRINNRILNPKK